jgi:DNA-directed RNA polymerase subunit RPC12/RpoP
MKCQRCGKRYHLDWAQSAPGGSSSPGYFFWISIVLASIASLLYWLEISPWYWVVVAIAIFVFVQVPIAYSDCTDEEDTGKQCPYCGWKNRAYWWSI